MQMMGSVGFIALLVVRKVDSVNISVIKMSVIVIVDHYVISTFVSILYACMQCDTLVLSI